MKIFQSTLKEKPVRVGDGDSYCWMLSTGRITVGENPVDLQQLSLTRAKMQSFIMDAAENYAKQHDYNQADVFDYVFGGKSKETSPFGDFSPITHLSGDARREYLTLANETQKTPYRAAVLMIQKRLLTHLELAQKVDAGSVVLKCLDLPESVASGDRFKFQRSRQVLEIESVNLATKELIVKMGVAADLDKGATAFKINALNELIVGCPEFSDADLDNLSESEVTALYEFYQREAGLISDESEPTSEVDGDSGKTGSSKPRGFDPTPPSPQLTGTEPTVDSNSLVAAIAS